MTRAEWDSRFMLAWQHFMNDEGKPSYAAHGLATKWMDANYGPRPATEPKPTQPQDESGAPASGPRASWILRLGAKVAGALLRAKMKDKLNRWLPIIGGVALAAEALLKAFGLPEVASIVSVISGTLGASQAVPSWVVTLVAAVVPAIMTLYGAIRKVKATMKAKS